MRLFDRPYLLLMATTLLWAGNAVASRLAVGHISPMVLTTFRWTGTVILVTFIAGAAFRREWPLIRSHWKWLAFMGVVGFTGFNSLFYLAAGYTSAINLGIIQGSIPGMVLLGAWLSYRTPIRTLQVAGIVVTLLGVVLLATRGHIEKLRDLVFNFGDILMLIACIGYAIYTVALRNRPQISPQPFFLALSIVALMSSIPLCIAEVQAGAAIWPDARGWLIVLFVATGPGFISQMLFMRGVELIGPGRAGLFVNLVPLWTAILGPLILGEVFAWYHGAALALVLGGIAIAEQAKPLPVSARPGAR